MFSFHTFPYEAIHSCCIEIHPFVSGSTWRITIRPVYGTFWTDELNKIRNVSMENITRRYARCGKNLYALMAPVMMTRIQTRTLNYTAQDYNRLVIYYFLFTCISFFVLVSTCSLRWTNFSYFNASDFIGLMKVRL